MRKDEKRCPRCAETVKSAALVCKHCRHELDEEKAPIIRSGTEYTDVDRLIRIKMRRSGGWVDELDCEHIAEETGKPLPFVIARLGAIGGHYDDGSEAAAVTRRKTLEDAIKEFAATGPLSHDQCLQIAENLGVTERAVKATLHRLGFKYDSSTYTPSEVPPPDRRTVSDIPAGQGAGSLSRGEIDYGPLQGVAAVTGGCATLWGWVIVLFAVAALLALVTGQLS